VRSAVLAALCVVGLAHAARAQPGDRLRVSVNAAAQVTSHTLTQSFTIPINVESAPISTSLDLTSAPMFDIGASYRILNRLAVGVSATSLSRSIDGTFQAKIPHPFFFNTLRPISGDLSGLTHKEVGAHIYAMYFVPVSSKLDVGIFGGPSHFSVKQDFVTDVDYTSSYPFDTATFTGAPTETVSRGATGYNVGADVSWRLSKVLAVGGLIRVTGASTTFTVASGNTIDADVGGLQTGAGVRIMF
jgi:outer membrane protein with beta-barrel domain